MTDDGVHWGDGIDVAAHLKAAQVLLSVSGSDFSMVWRHLVSVSVSLGPSPLPGEAPTDRSAVVRQLRSLERRHASLRGPRAADRGRGWRIPVAMVTLGLLVGGATLWWRNSPTAEPPVWQLDLYRERSLTDEPVTQRLSSVDLRWGAKAPAADIPADGFSAVAQTCLVLPETRELLLQLTSDDGSKLLIDGKVVLDNWGVHGEKAVSELVTVDGGNHHVQVMYFDDTGDASLEIGVRNRDGQPLEPGLKHLPPIGADETMPCGVPVPPLRFQNHRGWRARYYPSIDFSGTPLERRETRIRHRWRSRSPGESVPRDGFSARWDTCVRLEEPEPVELRLLSDDGSRAILDGVVVVDNWGVHGETARGATVEVPAGLHHLRVEYFEESANARVDFEASGRRGPLASRFEFPTDAATDWSCGLRLVLEPPSTKPVWRVAFFSNTGFEGNPTMGTAAAVNARWGDGSPHRSLPADGFSARFDSCWEIGEPTEVRFRLESDDGARLYVDGEEVVDNWGVHGERSREGGTRLQPGRHHLRVEYFDEAVNASVRLHAATPDRAWALLDGRWLTPPEGNEAQPCR